ncbi:Surface presentation of antigens protein spaK Class 1B type III secretion system chaperone spaK [Erwinia piriflorinigrans]|uniref:Surface presentation of antigens protein spaK Class 1B type III secretion system chaperone spaK n=1 Tax=Erwinia piriflorinigrans CFBP 5888 TaxID=1161919 RepID=V5Z6W6_9GAMM|nr:Surface presentation of antigens protein spaK Class 1B type III secretion system chaperone spaK [Erwinia piriflorinigrans]CCG87066.1 Surface presentation of antigens protein spaK Class 1B type III secretion system chaperone spaK [Erwinia piriflorinigrans CFBP 5888]
MKYDIAELISTMLKDAGMSEFLSDDLTNHSTISLNMKDDIPAIHIKSVGDDVWLWANLCEYNINSLAYCSINLLPVMLDYNEEVFYLGQPCLYPVDGQLELRAKVMEKYLGSADDFLSVLDHYLTIMLNYRDVLA